MWPVAFGHSIDPAVCGPISLVVCISSFPTSGVVPGTLLVSHDYGEKGVRGLGL